MAAKKLLNSGILIVITIIGILFLLSFVSSYGSGVIPGVEPKVKVTCNVKVGLTTFTQKANIEDLTCSSVQCGPFEQFTTFSILNKKGSIVMEIGGISDSKSYDLNILSRRSQTLTLSKCVPQSTTSGKVLLYDEQGNFIQEKSVMI